MKRIFIVVVLVLAIGGYALWSMSKPSVGSGVSTTPPATETTPPPSNPASPTTGQYKDGTYTGSSVSTIYGIVQVSAVISGGKLTDVTPLQFPNSQPNSVAVSNRSLPQLKNEAIVAQSANVDIVSGATQTSQGFQQSLGAALTEAQS